MSSRDEHVPTSLTPAPIRMAAGGFGVLFVAIGVLGFVPGVTTEHDELRMAGHDSGAHLFGLFQVSVLHNVLHLVTGVAGLALARTAALAQGYLVGAGIVYALLWLWGVSVDASSSLNVIPLDHYGDRLHLGLAVGMIVLGVTLGRSRYARSDDAG